MSEGVTLMDGLLVSTLQDFTFIKLLVSLCTRCLCPACYPHADFTFRFAVRGWITKPMLPLCKYTLT